MNDVIIVEKRCRDVSMMASFFPVILYYYFYFVHSYLFLYIWEYEISSYFCNREQGDTMIDIYDEMTRSRSMKKFNR